MRRQSTTRGCSGSRSPSAPATRPSSRSPRRTSATRRSTWTCCSWGPCLSVFMLYTFGTLDSTVHGPRAIGLWAALWLVQTVIMVVSYAVRGEAWAQIAFWAFFFLLSATAFGWLMHMLREELRARHRGARLAVARALTERLVKVVGLQIGLLVVGVVQGVAKRDYPRVYATALFSMSLLMAWFFALAIDEVAEVDVHAAAARLRLRPIEAAALFFTGCVVLSGLGLYVISEQSSPRRGTAQAAGNALMLSIILAFTCASYGSSGSLRRKRRSQVVATTTYQHNDDENPSPRRGGGRRGNRSEDPLRVRPRARSSSQDAAL